MTSSVTRVLAPVLAATLLALVLHASAPEPGRGGPARLPHRFDAASDGPPFVCGTDRRLSTSTSTPAAVPELEAGTPVSFQQDPPILRPDYQGQIRLLDLQVVGDIGEVTFRLWDPESQSYIQERWPRITTVSVAGRLVSVFELAWPNDRLRAHLRRTVRGFDYPYLFWGTLRVQTGDSVVTRSVSLRLGSTGLPPAQVVRIDDTAQYSSHVVNLVMPGFGDTRLSGADKDFSERNVARRFFELFADEYDSIAVVPARTHLATYTGFHRNVRNDVFGIGLDRYNLSGSYGSGGRLRSVEVFPGVGLPTHSTSNHEILHQWGHYFEWSAYGIAQPEEVGSHTPLLHAGETLVGYWLGATRRIGRTQTGFTIERTPASPTVHPLELYAMGLLPPQDVPDVWLFDEQDQFAGLSGAPAFGVGVRGGTRQVSISDVIALHGPRSGPTLRSWRRATVVVSRDQLMTPQEMAYWNFHAARLEDADKSGALSWDGHASFDLASGGRVDLQTDIVPKEAPPVELHANVGAPAFGRLDCRDFEFDTLLPTRFRVGDEIRIDGRTTATDQRFNTMLLAFWKYGGTADQERFFYDPVSGSGSFSPRVRFREGEEGTYYALLYLFWPDGPPQNARCTLSPVVVVPRGP